MTSEKIGTLTEYAFALGNHIWDFQEIDPIYGGWRLLENKLFWVSDMMAKSLSQLASERKQLVDFAVFLLDKGSRFIYTMRCYFQDCLQDIVFIWLFIELLD